MLTPAERCTILEQRLANQQREIAEMREQLDSQGCICEVREKRLRQQMDQTFEPHESRLTKTPKEPVPVAAFHQRVSRAEI